MTAKTACKVFKLVATKKRVTTVDVMREIELSRQTALSWLHRMQAAGIVDVRGTVPLELPPGKKRRGRQTLLVWEYLL